MNEAQFDRLIARLDRQILASNRSRKGRRFEGLRHMIPRPGDSDKVKSLKADYNHKARSYNRMGGGLRRLLQEAIDRNAPRVRPVDDLLGVIDEFLRLRTSRHQSLLRDAEPRIHRLETRMHDILHGPNGTLEISDRIEKLRDK